MRTDQLQNFFKKARMYCEKEFPEELQWAKEISPNTFKYLKSKNFLSEYCWVVYVSGFKVEIIKAKFPKLKIAFKDFDLDSLSRMRSINQALKIFNNEIKANCFLKGSKTIYEEGFSNFKKNLKNNGVDYLEKLPGIGPITKFHLAKNIGLIDAEKPDIWLVRVADEYNATVSEIVDFLSKKNLLSRHVVDVILWRYLAENGL